MINKKKKCCKNCFYFLHKESDDVHSKCTFNPEWMHFREYSVDTHYCGQFDEDESPESKKNREEYEKKLEDERDEASLQAAREAMARGQGEEEAPDELMTAADIAMAEGNGDQPEMTPTDVLGVALAAEKRERQDSENQEWAEEQRQKQAEEAAKAALDAKPFMLPGRPPPPNPNEVYPSPGYTPEQFQELDK